MKTRLLPVALASLALVAMAGCGRSDDDAVAATPTPAPADTAPPTTTAPAPTSTAVPAGATTAGLSATVGESDLGEIITNAAGRTLYGFVNDKDATSTCYNTCASAWPPVIVAVDWAVGPGLDTGVFSTTERDDGSLQLVAGTFPLYTYAGDAAPGDTTGQGSGDVWFAVNPDGTLDDGASTDATETTVAAAPEATVAPAPAPITVATTSLGDALVDANGLTLYGFTEDVDGVSTCVDTCAKAWPPATVDGADLPAGLDHAVFTVVDRPDGTHQLKAGKWPLYRFVGDSAPGETNGQGSGQSWFVVAANGTLIK